VVLCTVVGAAHATRTAGAHRHVMRASTHTRRHAATSRRSREEKSCFPVLVAHLLRWMAAGNSKLWTDAAQQLAHADQRPAARRQAM
jgi:hypothetical protein